MCDVCCALCVVCVVCSVLSTLTKIPDTDMPTLSTNNNPRFFFIRHCVRGGRIFILPLLTNLSYHIIFCVVAVCWVGEGCWRRFLTTRATRCTPSWRRCTRLTGSSMKPWSPSTSPSGTYLRLLYVLYTSRYIRLLIQRYGIGFLLLLGSRCALACLITIVQEAAGCTYQSLIYYES